MVSAFTLTAGALGISETRFGQVRVTAKDIVWRRSPKLPMGRREEEMDA